jgi:hypothetical protein
MIKLNYTDETNKVIKYELNDWDAVYSLAEMLLKAPIDIEYLEYQDGNRTGIFNLNNFERC